MVKKEDVLLLSKSLYIKITDKELDYLVDALVAYENRLSILSSVNSKDYTSMTFPFNSQSQDYQNWNYDNLRDDEIIDNNPSKLLEDNCDNLENNYVILPKVI